MDSLTAVVILGSLAIVVIPVTFVLRQYYAEKAARSRKMAAVQAAKTAKPAAKSENEVPEWLYEVLDQFGVSEDILDQDEMPPELKRLLPLAKGFIESGGLQKLLGASGNTENLPAGPDQGDKQGPWF